MEMKVEMWIDGSCIGNPGPMGAGVILKSGERTKEISKHLGYGTNNRAELAALIEGLLSLKNRPKTHVIVYTDSALVVGLFQGWKLKQNLDLVEKIIRLVKECGAFEIVKVRGHNGVELNERAHKLAEAAAHRAL